VWIDALRGQAVCIPPGTPHTYRNASHRITRLLVTITPAGMEDYFRAVGVRVTRTLRRELANPPKVSQGQLSRITEAMEAFDMSAS
jgi:hypothetical protein